MADLDDFDNRDYPLFDDLAPEKQAQITKKGNWAIGEIDADEYEASIDARLLALYKEKNVQPELANWLAHATVEIDTIEALAAAGSNVDKISKIQFNLFKFN